MNRRDALKQLAAVSAALPLANLAWAKEPFVVLNPAQQTDDPSKIEILEFFHYGCPHCRDFDPLVEAWSKKLPADVSFRQVPAIWNNPQLAALARLFYAAEASGDLHALHGKVFVAVQDERRPLHTEDGVGEWIGGKVADPAKFMDAYKSFGVNSKLQRADQLARAMKVQGVPTMAVDGRFLTSATMAGGHEGTLKVVDELAGRVRKERGAK
ncbi:thiol:disulfide interchange protein DsbA/DsbL [Thauera linaloolentis]|uniref:Thiol:disulfide interchange protein DsbA n=1 Tax=Thauera linaloolentis (strain DSM 12138 / JCM 21573 / CCUG 41526 / CIP 105981 / IAM 15112 / NBRC 102519 / 47Lol) TaxID=1123367 RepID=N6Y239_THAL4|nr:thiol:disulfide interchange protein DsbA/DsbL [Thauera linaloolentis]ENO88251.1 DSBA oxidoreductase [Thauera linaloolentis 47Lol = DSM 12138]MCM8566832.1 thiol:disulfide interchange protein DsbA/DsbL [Thauera linaloolentis]